MCASLPRRPGLRSEVGKRRTFVFEGHVGDLELLGEHLLHLAGRALGVAQRRLASDDDVRGQRSYIGSQVPQV